MKGVEVGRPYGFPDHATLFGFAGREVHSIGGKSQIVGFVVVTVAFGIFRKEPNVEVERPVPLNVEFQSDVFLAL